MSAAEGAAKEVITACFSNRFSMAGCRNQTLSYVSSRFKCIQSEDLKARGRLILVDYLQTALHAV
jgi:hypothetical protein